MAHRDCKFLILVALGLGLVFLIIGGIMRVPFPSPLGDTPQMAYQKHLLSCPECGNPLLDKDGNEHGICEVGFELLVKAMQAEKE